MAAIQAESLEAVSNDSTSRTSNVPVLGEGFSESTPPTELPTSSEPEQAASAEQEPKSGLRKFFNLGKKKEEPKSKPTQNPKSVPEPAKPKSPLSPLHPSSATTSPQYTSAPYTLPASPSRPLRSPSPRLISPASSQIFERNVQEDGLYSSASPAIPAHITTENHIPPVLDASSVAITDDHLDPDSVEIVMSSAHQPAAVTVTGAGVGGHSQSEAAGAPWSEELVAHPDSEDAASNYGALDAADVRRLSFISFADVVHAEQADHSSLRDSVLLSSAPSLASPGGARSPSPIRSPVSPSIGGRGSPPFRTAEQSPSRMPGSPRGLAGHSPPAAGELTIETLSQSIRKSGSRDLTGIRSVPMSAGEEGEGTFR